ncbi:hypothetical protein C8R45DRAFT_938597 [Mycena sanguinolenta]|nr:hypothetical protein C8R45DRAFT_938597 [Mycena sanguinolenta]
MSPASLHRQLLSLFSFEYPAFFQWNIIAIVVFATAHRRCSDSFYATEWNVTESRRGAYTRQEYSTRFMTPSATGRLHLHLHQRPRARAMPLPRYIHAPWARPAPHARRDYSSPFSASSRFPLHLPASGFRLPASSEVLPAHSRILLKFFTSWNEGGERQSRVRFRLHLPPLVLSASTSASTSISTTGAASTSSTGAELLRKQHRSKCNRRRKRGAELLRPVSQYPVVRGWGWDGSPDDACWAWLSYCGLLFTVYKEEKCIFLVGMREEEAVACNIAYKVQFGACSVPSLEFELVFVRILLNIGGMGRDAGFGV